MKVANTMEVRQQNALNILHDIECNPGITNAEIAQSRGLSIPTISNIVNIMKSSNMIVAAGTGESSGGRRPLQLSLNGGYQSYIGVTIAKHTVYLVLIDFEGVIHEKQRFYLDFAGTKEYWQEIAGMIEDFRKKTEVPCKVGLALPGFVDYSRNMIYDTYTLGVSDVSLNDIHEILGEDVTIGDSCRLAALAQVFGKDDYNDTFFVLLSRRISGILIHGNEIFQLKRSSMDIGSMILDSTGQTSKYGLPGSFLELCTASRIIDILKESTNNVKYEEFFAEIDNGNQKYIALWDEYLKNLTIALHNIFSVFCVDIVLGGEMAKYIEPDAQKMDHFLEELVPGGRRDTTLRFSTYGEYDDAFGAALEARSMHIAGTLPEILKNAAMSAPVQIKGKPRKR